MPTETDADRAVRLLRRMHPVFSHDLPNQVVALQSLLQMLEMGEVDRLSPEGRDYIVRLQRVAGRVHGLVRFLKDVGRLDGYQRRTEEVALSGLVRDLTVELRQQLPEARVECRLETEVRTVRADPRLLTQALVEIVRCVLEPFAGGAAALRLVARPADAGVELTGEIVRGKESQHAALTPRGDRARLEQRLEMVLAQEFLCAWGARLVEIREGADRSRFVMHIPGPVADGGSA